MNLQVNSYFKQIRKRKAKKITQVFEKDVMNSQAQFLMKLCMLIVKKKIICFKKYLLNVF